VAAVAGQRLGDLARERRHRLPHREAGVRLGAAVEGVDVVEDGDLDARRPWRPRSSGNPRVVHREPLARGSPRGIPPTILSAYRAPFGRVKARGAAAARRLHPDFEPGAGPPGRGCPCDHARDTETHGWGSSLVAPAATSGARSGLELSAPAASAVNWLHFSLWAGVGWTPRGSLHAPSHTALHRPPRHPPGARPASRTRRAAVGPGSHRE
jgi:hypothetical protein